MALRSTMVSFFTLCTKTSAKANNFLRNQCLALIKEKLEPMTHNDKHIRQSRSYSEGPGSKKGPKKEEQIEKIKMPGFVHPHTQNEEGYFTQKAHQQLEELKKKVEKPAIDNTEKKD